MTFLRFAQVAIIVATLSLGVASVNAEDVCPCVPVTKLWVTTVCDTWNCAMAALVNANGDPAVFAVPVAMKDNRWLVVKQVAAGGYVDDSPFQVDSFDGIPAATARFASIANEFKPHIMSSPDGKFLVISLRDPEGQPAKRRAVGH
jgi:hypothetical protein